MQDPLVRELARRIELVPLEESAHETPGFWPAEVIIEAAGQHHALHTRPHKGSPSNPFTWDEICEKFLRYTASIIDATRATAVVEAVRRLEQVTDMADVAERLASK